MNLSNIDKEILTLLQKDARLTNAQIAERIGLSQSACHRHIKQLEETGLITGYKAQVNRKAIGLKLVAYVFVKLDAHTENVLKPFREGINAMEEVILCHAISGSGDYLLKVVTTDMEAFADVVLTKLVRIKGVRDISSNFVLSTAKPETGLPL